MAKIILDKQKIENKLGRALTAKSYQNLAQRNAQTRFDNAVRETLKFYDEHVITQEIKDGPKAENSVLGYGNLDAFLSIKDGPGAAAKVRLDLFNGFQDPVFSKVDFNSKRVIYEFKVKAPSLQEIYDANPTPTNFSTRGWPQIIEEGIGNFSFFVFRLLGLPNSVSGTGLQRKTKRKWLDVPNSSPKIKWISEVLNKFKGYFTR